GTAPAGSARQGVRNASRTGGGGGGSAPGGGGISGAWRRRYSPARPTAKPSRNGTRQPQASTAAAEKMVLVKAPTADPSSMPALAPKRLQLPMNPRRSGAALSTKKTTEVVNSPPTDSPCIKRNPTRST